VGRGHLVRLVTLLCAASIVVTSAWAADVRWREVARGSTVGGAGPARPAAVVVASRARARVVARRLPAAGRASLSGLDLSRAVAVAVFGNFGCTDHRVAVRSITRVARTLRIVLVVRPLPADQVECQAIYGTYRLLAAPKAQLGAPVPTRAEVALARP
jgi:hypothetical protein